LRHQFGLIKETGDGLAPAWVSGKKYIATDLTRGDLDVVFLVVIFVHSHSDISLVEGQNITMWV
jgi:hypothetical protein